MKKIGKHFPSTASETARYPIPNTRNDTFEKVTLSTGSKRFDGDLIFPGL